MITGAIKNKVDKIWTDIWAGGLTNPLTVIEQLTYLIFIRTWLIRAYVEETVVPTEVLGAILYRNGELISELVTDESYIDINAQAGDEYTLRVVYGGEPDVMHYAMSCPQTAKINDVSIAENTTDDVTIYPNPTNGILNINAEAMKNITVINMAGQVVYKDNVDKDVETIDMSQFNTGIYMVRITTENDVIVRQVSVVE